MFRYYCCCILMCAVKLLVCVVVLILEINKTVIVASSWSSIFTLPIFYVFISTLTCLEQPRAHNQENQLYQYNLWYMSLRVDDRFVCRSERNLSDLLSWNAQRQLHFFFDWNRLAQDGPKWLSHANTILDIRLYQRLLIFWRLSN
jgi:hypothetical protein